VNGDDGVMMREWWVAETKMGF